MKNYFSALLIGPPGVGKTTASSTAPKPILYLDVDNKLHKMVNLKDKLANGQVKQLAIDEPLANTTLVRMIQLDPKPGAKATLKRPKGYTQLAEAIDGLVASGCVYDGIKYETIVLDSYTSVNEHLKRLLMAANGTTTMTLPLYGTALSNFEILNNTLLRLPANIIMICHEKIDKDELNGQVSYRPLIDGSMSHKIGKDFEEVYYLEKKVQGAKVKYEMLTIGNSMKSCRTSRILEARVEPDFAKIYGV